MSMSVRVCVCVCVCVCARLKSAGVLVVHQRPERRGEASGSNNAALTLHYQNDCALSQGQQQFSKCMFFSSLSVFNSQKEKSTTSFC